MPRKPPTRQAQKAATRADLLRIGRRVFTRHGYDATSVAMLCRAAGVTHGALYHHFPSKLELFAAVTDDLARDVADRVQRAADGAKGWAQVEAACDAYLAVCGDPALATILLRDAPRVLPAYDEIDHAANEPMVAGLLRRWIDAGLLRPVPVLAVARMIGGAFAEAGAAIAADATVTRDVRAVLLGWLGTLRARR